MVRPIMVLTVLVPPVTFSLFMRFTSYQITILHAVWQLCESIVISSIETGGLTIFQAAALLQAKSSLSRRLDEQLPTGSHLATYKGK